MGMEEWRFIVRQITPLLVTDWWGENMDEKNNVTPHILVKEIKNAEKF